MTTPFYPLLTERRLVEPLWGGARLAAWLDLPEPRPHNLGETWQVYDSNPILNGTLKGYTLAEAARTYAAALVGTRTMARYGADLPLLAKFIDANDRLSVQVHPDDTYAHAYEATTGFHGKTEAWYILDTAPHADVTYGLTRTVSREQFAAAIESGNQGRPAELEALMHRIAVQPGDVVFVPAGTLHAINAGIVLFEIQQKSDLTYRVYDYGRRDPRTGKQRELHLNKALDVSILAPADRSTVPPLHLASDGTRTLLTACTYFALERWSFDAPLNLTTSPETFEILTLLDGEAALHWPSDPQGIVLRRGDSVTLPAALGAYTLEPSGAVTLLRVTVPDLAGELVPQLRTLGYSDAQIAATVAE